VFACTRSSFSKTVTASRQICERLQEKFRQASQRRRKLVALFRGERTLSLGEQWRCVEVDSDGLGFWKRTDPD
jgi:hypothetical protein